MDEPSDDRAWPEGGLSSEGIVADAESPSFASRLDRWLADARVEGSADARARERWLQAAAQADATFSGVLLDLAERHTAVAVSTSGGRRHVGGLQVIGADFVSLRLPSGTEVLLSLAAVAAIRTAPRSDAALGERLVTTELRLADVLGELASERTWVQVVPVGGSEAVAGELRGVGRDVVTVRSDGDPPTTAYVPLRAIAEVTIS